VKPPQASISSRPALLWRAAQGESGPAQGSGGKDGGGMIIWICIGVFLIAAKSALERL